MGKIGLFKIVFNCFEIMYESWVFDLWGGGGFSKPKGWARFICSTAFLKFLKSSVIVGLLICMVEGSSPY